MESHNIQMLRLALGRELADRRQAAGLTQAELARITGYARSTVSTVESGRQHVLLEFWECCDKALHSGGTLTAAFRQMERVKAAEDARPSWQTAAPPAASEPTTLGAYQRMGWPAEECDDRLELITGDQLEALELGRPAAMLAVHWWLGTSGVQDEIRGLPALPAPSESLAVIAADDRYYFLVRGGACPWIRSATEARPEGWNHRRPADVPDIRWHAGGCRIPAPRSVTSAGANVAWLHMPTGPIRLPNPVTLLDLLAKAASAVRREPDALALPGGILAVPAWETTL